MIRQSFNIFAISKIGIPLFYLDFDYPSGKPITSHDLRPVSYGVFVVKGAVDDHSFDFDAARSKMEIPLSG
jgi:hypothetical protein